MSPRGIEIVGGSVEADGTDVTVRAPTPDLRNQAVVSSPRTDALLIGRDSPLSEASCFACHGGKGAPVGVQIKWPKDDGDRLSICIACIVDHYAAKRVPFLIDMEMAD